MTNSPPMCARPQDYIEAENARLEREGQFWSKEIVVRIEYKYCPNLTIIDTPGAMLGLTCMLGHAGPGGCTAGSSCAGRAAYPDTHGAVVVACMLLTAGLISAAPGRNNGHLQGASR